MQFHPIMYSWLALGDSYTIGEGVKQEDSYPFQTVALLRNENLSIADPQIIAKTGWTTAELKSAMKKARLQPAYDMVSLLIGVNNQYRGWPLNQYKIEFEELLKWSLQLAGRHSRHVFVISIPDWGVTPFAEGRDRQKIANEINQFNEANKFVTDQYQVNYLDITPGTREAAKNSSLLGADHLHPSAKEYARWSNLLATQMKKILQ